MKKLNSWLILTLGIVLTLAGVSFSGMYVIEAIIERSGEPDQSLIFWYLPILFIGVGAMVIGSLLLVFGIKRLRISRSETNQV